MINLLDDFHNILTIRMPSDLKLSIATHMASSLLDVHPSVPAVEIPSGCLQHSQIKLVGAECTETLCRGGIASEYIHHLIEDNKNQMNNTYMGKQNQNQNISPTDIQHQLKELRYYFKYYFW